MTTRIDKSIDQSLRDTGDPFSVGDNLRDTPMGELHELPAEIPYSVSLNNHITCTGAQRGHTSIYEEGTHPYKYSPSSNIHLTYTTVCL